MAKFTIFGGNGYIGQHLTSFLEQNAHDCFIPKRDQIPTSQCGHIVYAIGVTADFREKPFETVEAHVCKLLEVLKKCSYSSFLYLSSTRVYEGISEHLTVDETTNLNVNPSNFSCLYNLSKLMGESICLNINNPLVRVVRLSNVYGQDMSSETFLGSLMESSKKYGRVSVYQSKDSGKDYIHVDDVVRIIPKISINGQHRLYNLASGILITHEDIAALFFSRGKILDFEKNAPKLIFPRISVNRLNGEFNEKIINFNDGFYMTFNKNSRN